MEMKLRMALNSFAAVTGHLTVEQILARQDAKIVRLSDAPIRKPKPPSLFFIGKKDD